MKHSKFQGIIAWSGGTQVMKIGQRYADDHPLVVERADLFDDGDTDEGVVQAPTPASIPTGPTIERATHAPGEIRNTPATGPRVGTRVPKVTGQ